LHPSIAQEILTGLKLTFPQIQFIISTHSPLVITNFKQNDHNLIYKLFCENGDYKNERVDDLYGIDYNSGLRDWMETSYRKSQIDELLKAYKYWSNADNRETKERLKNKLKEALGENSELYKSLK
jgi:predicted ATP-binding protein involved in virulence